MGSIQKNLSLKEQVEALGKAQPWNHNFQLPDGTETRSGHQSSHGKNLVKLARLEPLFERISITRKTVLDVGCNEGFFSVHLAQKGADVLGIDVDVHRISKAKFIQGILATKQEVVFDLIDIYSEKFKLLPRFDLCLCLGFIHRVPDPFRAIAAIGEKADMIIFEWKALKFGPHDEAFAYFSHKDFDTADPYGTEYWLLSYTALERILRRLGFSFFHRVDDPTQRRAILVAGRNPHMLFNSPDVIGHRGVFRALMTHGKRFVKTLIGIMTGRLNA